MCGRQSLEPELDLEPDGQKGTVTQKVQHMEMKSLARAIILGFRILCFHMPLLKYMGLIFLNWGTCTQYAIRIEDGLPQLGRVRWVQILNVITNSRC